MLEGWEKEKKIFNLEMVMQIWAAGIISEGFSRATTEKFCR